MFSSSDFSFVRLAPFARWQKLHASLINVFSIASIVLRRESTRPFSNRVTAFRDGIPIYAAVITFTIIRSSPRGI